jgi:hypothetical protein
MTQQRPRRSRWRIALALAAAMLTGGSLAAATAASAAPRGDDGFFLRPGNLLVSGSSYDLNPDILVPGVTVLPPGCTSGCVTATNDGTYPQVFNNALVDGSFGLTTPMVLDQLTPSGLRPAWTSAPRTPCPATRPATTRPPGCRGLRPRTACATSPAASTRTAR